MDRQKILIVDKNKNTQFAFRLFLENEGYKIYEAYSLDEVLHLIDGDDFLAAFIDLSNPLSEQLELIKKIRNMACNLNIIIISSIPTQDLYILVDQIGAVDLLEKPPSIIKLRQILQKISN